MGDKQVEKFVCIGVVALPVCGVLDFLSLNGRSVVSQLYEVDDIENFDPVFDGQVLNSR